ncbi:tetratricopeptide repeat protein [Desulfovibrio mangrovi]|uniref:tetratricopeptide repeat protein n=1 Tax=Desulfovibrio mangrovi TaxID=2976983 RepID=UPI0022476C01|nr:tetratricopeptide repeat protein [Desulfovibrio mangrovi]UZP65907.1 tetratricopeptide repeat protein [Desulfovibrio mangrovi]
MKRITTISVAAATIIVMALTGCMGSKQDQGSSMSLKERYHSGKSLLGNERDLTADGKEQNLTKDQADARESFMRGLAYANQGRQELALEQYSRAAMLDPYLMQARYQRGLLFLEKQLPAPALEEFKAVMELSPDFAPGYASTGRVYFLNGLYPEAEKFFNKALEIDPELLDAYDHLGAIHNYNKEYEKALGTFQKAIMLNPNAAYLYNNLGLAYSMLGRDKDAVEAFRKAVMQGAPSSKAYNNMGLALCRLGKYREGLEAFRAASGEAAGWNNLGYFFFLDGQYERAIKSFEKAIELEPTYYERAAENLKRARLAAQFTEGSEGSPARPYTQDDLFAPRPPAVPSNTYPMKPPQVIPTNEPASAPAAKKHTLTKAEPSKPSTSAAQPAKAVATGPKTPEPAQPRASKSYALHVSSFRSRAAAESHAAELHQRNMDARVVSVLIPDKGEWHRVLVNSFTSVDEAKAGLLALQATHPELTDIRVVNAGFFTDTAQASANTAEETAPSTNDTANALPEAAISGQAHAIQNDMKSDTESDATADGASAPAGPATDQMQAADHTPDSQGGVESLRVPAALMLQP